MDLARKTAFEILFEIEKEDAYSNLTINRFLEKNKPENPAFIRELVYGVLENKLLLDYYLDNLIPSGIKKVKKKEATLLRLGLYQLIFMDSVPDYAAVNETVNIAKKLCRGREGFINGVLRGYMKKGNSINLPDENDDFKKHLSIKYSFPLWLIEKWETQYGIEECKRLLEASNSRPQLSIRVNVNKTSRDELKLYLEEKGFEVSVGEFSKRTLHVKGSGLLEDEKYKDGYFSVQDEASTVCADQLGAKPGEIVIDVCAAPGGKTSAVAEMMNNQGTVYSCDIYEHKLELIEKLAERLGLSIVEPTLLDGTKGQESWLNMADRVLCDVPCSGLGVIRRKPEIKYKEVTDFTELVSIQKDILYKACKYVKAGGTLVYSTCTINKDENQLQIEKFLKDNDEFEMVYEKQFLPTENIDGFYVCKMIKSV